MRARYGAPFLDLHRVDLQRALAARARALGVVFRLGAPVAGIDCGGSSSSGGTGARVTLTTRGGDGGAAAAATGDVLVAADGVWSTVRALHLGLAADPPLATGDLAYRVVLSAAQAAGDEALAALIRNPECRFWIGPGAHAVGYSLRAGDMYNIVLLVPDDLPAGVRKARGNVDEMRAFFEGWDPILRSALDKVDTVEKWRLMHREFLTWAGLWL